MLRRFHDDENGDKDLWSIY